MIRGLLHWARGGGANGGSFVTWGNHTDPAVLDRMVDGMWGWVCSSRLVHYYYTEVVSSDC